VRRIVVALVCVLLPTTTLSPALAAATLAPPDTPAGRQVAWVIDVSHRLPVTAAEAAQHIAPPVLAAIGIDGLNAALASVVGTGLTFVSATGTTDTVTAVVTVAPGGSTWLLDLAVDGTGLIAGIRFRRPAPTSFEELHARLKALAPDVSFLTAELDHGRCEPIDTVAASQPRPLGSAFKLYVLGTLAHAIDEKEASWSQTLAIHEEWKSFPSGDLQNLPAGTLLPLGTYADKMISISDNTAADHLIHFLGRDVVEEQLRRFGMARPRADEPFLTTREFFQLKLNNFPSLADAYTGLDRGDRLDYLTQQIDPLPLPPLGPWTQPRAIDSIEWFGSPSDICRAYAGLQGQAKDPALSGVDHALSINDGGIGLDRQQWSRVWFKGGSEPGVLTLNYLATTTDGRTFVVSAMVSNPVTAFDETYAAVEGIALVNGAFSLAAAAR
jgi:beta-lactamase class A